MAFPEAGLRSSREKERQRHSRREKQAPCWEPDVGLDPRTRSLDSRITPWAKGLVPGSGTTVSKIWTFLRPKKGNIVINVIVNLNTFLATLVTNTYLQSLSI